MFLVFKNEKNQPEEVDLKKRKYIKNAKNT